MGVLVSFKILISIILDIFQNTVVDVGGWDWENEKLLFCWITSRGLLYSIVPIVYHTVLYTPKLIKRVYLIFSALVF